PGRGGCCTAPAAALRENGVRQEEKQRGDEKELEARLAIAAGGRGASLPPQPRQRIAHARALVRCAGGDEDATRGVRGGLQRGRCVARHDNLPRDIALERRALSAGYRNRAPCRGAETHGDEPDARVAGALRRRDNVLLRFEGLSITHDDQRLVRPGL